MVFKKICFELSIIQHWTIWWLGVIQCHHVILFCVMNLIIILLKLLPHLPGATDFMLLYLKWLEFIITMSSNKSYVNNLHRYTKKFPLSCGNVLFVDLFNKQINHIIQPSSTGPIFIWASSTAITVPVNVPAHSLTNGLEQGCSICSALAMEILTSCTKPSVHGHQKTHCWLFASHFIIMILNDRSSTLTFLGAKDIFSRNIQTHKFLLSQMIQYSMWHFRLPMWKCPFIVSKWILILDLQLWIAIMQADRLTLLHEYYMCSKLVIYECTIWKYVNS